MNRISKILITSFIVSSVLSAFILWGTRELDLKSQSMYFDQPNVIWYILMHVGIMMSFWTLNSSFKERPIYGMIAFASLSTLAFDLGGFEMLHNISTAVLFLLACISVMLFEPIKKLSIPSISLAAAAFGAGLFGLLGSSGIFLGETIAEIILSILIIKEVWINNK